MASKRGESNIPAFLGEHLALLQKDYSFSGYERAKVWRNTNPGFVDISGISGADSISDGRAAVFVDYDDDGDLDIFLRSMHGRAHFLFRNEIGQDQNWLRVILTGTRSGRDAFGAVVRVKSARGVQAKIKQGGGRFCAQSDPRLLFGLGDAESVEWIEVTWPDGRKQKLAGARAGATIRIEEQ
ncbi:MAG: ASPIC/UnbV domain-containing protein [Planctomycetota bacterium]